MAGPQTVLLSFFSFIVSCLWKLVWQNKSNITEQPWVIKKLSLKKFKKKRLNNIVQ
jgi:hypothetical protein